MIGTVAAGLQPVGDVDQVLLITLEKQTPKTFVKEGVAGRFLNRDEMKRQAVAISHHAGAFGHPATDR